MVEQQDFASGGIYFANPSASKRFYPHLLLAIVVETLFFYNIRTIQSVIHPTSKEACTVLGVLEDDGE